MKMEKITAAAALPEEWDTLCGDNLYLRREFLAFVEKTERYDPTYWLFYEGESLDSYFISFRRKRYNLGMFTKYNLFITVTLIYLPMCVTRSGMVLGKRQEDVFSQIRKIKGYKMILNLPEPVPGFACGLTCPKCILDLTWKTPEEYLAAMRSGYRYRIKKALKASASLTLRVIDNKTEFSDELYAMYLAVLHASKIRIETLSKEYFMGDAFKIFVLENQGRAVGFVQLLENGSELIFEFVGIDYSCHERFDTYERMLYEIVCWGITHGFKTVDFGQTADDAKLKLGSHYVPLYACLHHSHPLILAICRLLAKKIEYKPLTTPFRVFSDRGRAEVENAEREVPG